VSLRVEQFSEPHAFHGEGPVWCGQPAGLHLMDMLAGDVLRLNADGAVAQRTHVGTVAAAIRPRAGGGLVMGVERGFALIEPDGRIVRLPQLWEDPGVRMNEGACDPSGAFYCGSMAYDHTPAAGSLYRLDPSGNVTEVVDSVGCSNGLAWSPDGALAYYVDSFTHRIDVFDEEGSRLNGRRSFVDLADVDGMPDGLTVDSEGGVWVAFYTGSSVRRYDAGGTLDAVVDLPVSRVTACTFGGDDLADLFITTSREGLADDEEPQAGAVFTARPGVTGMAPLSFAG
jgi:sugar lactone lactonase YvrE